MRCLNSFFNTDPIVVHNPGEILCEKWWELHKMFFRMPPKKCGPPKDATIITWNNKPENGVLEASLDHLGVPYRVLGKNVNRWRNDMKIKLTLAALEAVQTKYVIGVDSFDVMVLDDPSMIVERFETNFNCKMLFNADPIQWPDFPEINYEDLNAGLFRYLNAGVWIGEKNFVKFFFEKCEKTIELVRTFVPQTDNEKCLQKYRESEQKHVKYVSKLMQKDVKIDYRCRIFQLLYVKYVEWNKQWLHSTKLFI